MPDDPRGSYASGTAICPSCCDAVYDVKRSCASPLRLSVSHSVSQSVSQSSVSQSVSQFVDLFSRANSRGSAHDTEETRARTSSSLIRNTQTHATWGEGRSGLRGLLLERVARRHRRVRPCTLHGSIGVCGGDRRGNRGSSVSTEKAITKKKRKEKEQRVCPTQIEGAATVGRGVV